MGIDAFWGNIFKRNSVTNTIAILKNVPLFSDLKVPDLIKLSKSLHYRKFYQNEIVFYEKEPGAGMYIVKSGAVDIFLKSLDGEEKKLVRLEEGTFFGEVALIDEAARSASARAAEDTELWGFFRSDLINFIDRDPRLSSKILLRLAFVIGQRLRETNLNVKRLQQHATS